MLEDYVTLCEEYVSPPLLDPSPSLVESVYQEDVSDVNSQVCEHYWTSCVFLFNPTQDM